MAPSLLLDIRNNIGVSLYIWRSVGVRLLWFEVVDLMFLVVQLTALDSFIISHLNAAILIFVSILLISDIFHGDDLFLKLFCLFIFFLLLLHLSKA